jgi:hypothetical protein
MRDFSIPISMDTSPAAIGRYGYLAAVVALLVALLYIGFIVTTDNTNLGTTNGLWKTPSVSAWEHGTAAPLDSGEFLYLPAYGFLARLIPDRLVQYGIQAPVVTFRKMAILDGIFGGLASGLVFFMALRFSNSLPVACLVALAHAGAGFVLLNSINSEDIIPAYTCFLGASVCFFEYLFLRRVWLLLSATLLFALATLFHWTTMPPGMAAFAAVLMLMMCRTKSGFLIGAAWLFLFACIVQIIVLLLFPRLHIPIWAVLYPGKGSHAGGWVGLSLEKIQYLIIGIGNYFCGANDDASYRTGLQGSHLRFVILSWIYFVPALGASIVTLFSKRSALALKYLAVFAIALLAAGEAGAFYSQPQDPQMQIQPMFATVAGLIVIGSRCLACRPTLRRAIGAGFLAIALANGVTNVVWLRRDRGGDSRALRDVHELESLFPWSNTVIVCHGFEGWITWQYAVERKGDSKAFLDRSFHLARPFTTTRDISGQDAAMLMRSQIDGAFAGGLRVVAGALWTEAPEHFIASLTTVTEESQARVYDAALRNSYRLGTKWTTAEGPFVELLPKERAP